jgi:uncharacterized protein YbjT (DUF2867 family)
MGKTAIILGATGLTGSLLLQKFLKDNRYTKIKLFSRKPSSFKHSKIEEFIVNLLELEHYKSDFTADEVFCCIGTTNAKTPDKIVYHQIDFGIPVTAAKLSKDNEISTFIVVSALGADANSRVFYNKTKGEMEDAVLINGIDNTYILQPSLIGGQRDEKRGGESMAKAFMTFLNPLLIGSLKKYRSINPETIADSMIWLANNNYASGRVSSEVIKQLSQNT